MVLNRFHITLLTYIVQKQNVLVLTHFLDRNYKFFTFLIGILEQNFTNIMQNELFIGHLFIHLKLYDKFQIK